MNAYPEIGVTSRNGGQMSRREKITAAKAEKKQQREEAGFVSELFPKVVKIGISMTYAQTGVLEPLTRAINFSPNSHAIFKVNCLCSDCIEGGFDFTKIISSMVRAGKTALKGEINCDDCSLPECSDAAYSITIKYALTK
ncbi:MAG TPA: hypothetical protein VJW95_04775 [Dissulfurispiraceae bacterium]|nr:hypothetical protein [Dissulfurispiraceae bacterium]